MSRENAALQTQARAPRQFSLSTLKVLSQLSKDAKPTYGFALATQTGLRSGSLYPILKRLEGDGLVKSQWEQLNPAEAGRPPRRYLSLTQKGRVKAEEALDRLKEEVGLS